MLTMDNIHNIRKLYFEEGKSITQVSKETGNDRKTVRKYIEKEDFNVPIVTGRISKKSYPKLEPYKGLIDQWLEEDKKRRVKQRHTAKRIFNRLEEEGEGFDCSYRLVAEYVAEKKKEMQMGRSRSDGFIPLNHFPGEAQADFGYADFYENGERISGQYLVLTFPYSNAGFIQLIYEETL